MDTLIKGFKPSTDIEVLKKTELFLFRKNFGIDKKVIYSKRFLLNILKIYIHLYPIYLFSTSNNLKIDLKDYDKKVKQIEIKS